MTPQMPSPQGQPMPGAPGVMRATVQPLTKQQILAKDSDYNKALGSLVQGQIRQEPDREQSVVFAKIRRNNLYYRGFQYLTMVRGMDGKTIDFKPITGGMTLASPKNGDITQEDLYDNILPLFRGDVRKWTGVLGVRSPNAKCSARMPGDDHQIRLSRIGDRAVAYLKETWCADHIQKYLAYSLAVNGTTFGYVNFIADQKKYGTTAVPQLEVQQVPVGEPYFDCWRCGAENPVMQVQQTGRCMQCEAELHAEDYREPETVPALVQNGFQHYANGAVQLQLGTGASVKTPYYSTNLDPAGCDVPWVWYEYLANRYELIGTYAPPVDPNDKSPDGQFRKLLREQLLQDRTTDPGGSSTAELRRTVNTLSSPSGMPYERKSLANFGQYFVSPGLMEALPQDQSGNLRDQLIANFPKGMHLVYINGLLADVREASIPEHWSVCQPDVGDFIYRDAVFDDYIQGVDVINDSLNMLIQQAEKSNPLTFFDPEYVDPDSLRNRQVQVGEFLEAKKSPGGQLASGFFRIPASEISDALIKFIEFYIQKNRENVGIMPAIYGGGEADEAVGVAKIRRNQSLMQLNVPWNYMRDFWSQTYMNGLRLLARYSNGKLITNKNGTIEIEELDGIWELEQGGIKIETEESMPLTWAQRQEQVDSMLSKPPQAWALLGVADQQGQPMPDNVESLQEYVGMPDWKVPGLDARERLLDIIQQLLQAAPLPGQPDPMTGQPGPPQPSIQPSQIMFDAPFAVKVLRDWLVGDKGREAEKGSLPGQGPQGFDNVLAYTQAWMTIANPPPPPPGPPPGGPGGGGPPAPGPQPPPPDQQGVAAPPPPGPDQQGVAASPPAGLTPQPPGPPTIQ